MIASYPRHAICPCPGRVFIRTAAVCLLVLLTTTGAAPADSKPAATQPAWTPLKPATVDLTLEFLRVNEPDVYESATVLRDKDPQKFDLLIRDIWSDVKKLLELQKHNPDMFAQAVADRRLGYKGLQLAKDIRDETLSADVRKAKSDELRSVISQQFDTRRRLRTMELDELAARINHLQDKLNTMKHQIEDRDEHKDDLVNQRLKELLSENPKVDW
jgi:hypothetical protein